MTLGLSVIIITHNRRGELKQTLKELNNEKCSFPWEIIVIDQNSTDGTREIHELKNEKVRYFYLSENLGVAGGRNVGAKYAVYEYMLFIDDDSSLTGENELELIYNYVCTRDHYSMFAFQIRNLENELYNWPYGRNKICKVNEEFDCKFFIGCGHVIRKSFFDTVGGYSDVLFFWGEETELIYKSCVTGNFPVRYNGNIIIRHRVHGNGRNSDGNRFYYKVRNRFFLINQYFSGVDRIVYTAWYICAYFIRALQYNWEKEFFKGIKDEKMMPKDRSQKRMTREQLKQYMKM